MNQFQAIVILALLPLTFYAQDDSTSVTKIREVGLDALFINTFLPIDQQLGRADAHDFHLRVSRSDGRFVRVGADILVSNTRSDNSEDANTTRNLNVLAFKVGGGSYARPYESVRVFYGWDVTARAALSRIKVEDDPDITFDTGNKRIDNNYTLGTGPHIGIQYNPTKRIGFYIEATMYGTLDYNYESFAEEDSGFNDFTNKSRSFGLDTRLPFSFVAFYQL